MAMRKMTFHPFSWWDKSIIGGCRVSDFDSKCHFEVRRWVIKIFPNFSENLKMTKFKIRFLRHDKIDHKWQITLEKYNLDIFGMTSWVMTNLSAPDHITPPVQIERRFEEIVRSVAKIYLVCTAIGNTGQIL